MIKYITIRENNAERIIVFSPNFQHNEIARRVGGEVLGAGFVNWEKMECYGESISLGIPCHPSDTGLLQMFIHRSEDLDWPSY